MLCRVTKKAIHLLYMEEIKDFKSFYATKLQPFLNELKLQSDDVSKWSIRGILSLMAAVVSFVLGGVVLGIIFSGGLIYCIYKYAGKRDVFINNYKMNVIKEIIKYLNPEMIYSPWDSMAAEDYEKSGHYTRIYDYYSGDDHVKGVYKSVNFFCSELETTYERPTRSGTATTPIFCGLFFAAPSKIFFSGCTYVWPAGEEQMARSLADQYYRMINIPDVYYVDTQHTEFESGFSVYSTNVAEANSLIDKELRDCLINFKKQINRDVRLSFAGGVCYVSVAINEELFEPSISRADSKEKIKEYFFSVLLILSVINQLNLTRYC